jgi:hypothetical protein
VIAVVTIDDAAADVAAGVVLLAGLAAIARTVIRLAGDPGPSAVSTAWRRAPSRPA